MGQQLGPVLPRAETPRSTPDALCAGARLASDVALDPRRPLRWGETGAFFLLDVWIDLETCKAGLVSAYRSRSNLIDASLQSGLEGNAGVWTAIDLGGTCGGSLQSDRKGADLQSTTPYVLLAATSSPISTTTQPIGPLLLS
jgi:hypothetical protein